MKHHFELEPKVRKAVVDKVGSITEYNKAGNTASQPCNCEAWEQITSDVAVEA